ncbi:MAG TPA: c-type cytochrome [Rhodocyclaceae bacterium]|nr:c-type cytochrome [Rhodocyclaceae bacterium]
MKVMHLALAASLISTAALAHAQNVSPVVVRSLAATCANCHGTNGKAIASAGMEALAGESKEKLLQKLKDFRSGAKPATIMHQISKGYSEEQLALVAEYFSAQK